MVVNSRLFCHFGFETEFILQNLEKALALGALSAVATLLMYIKYKENHSYGIDF